ncbi:MAG: MFS transporter [Bacteroidales bacterium]|jgi:FLVCR family feline leukemia virus subgroup C receptor-related protein|nr:MFS transporter [Bacteroidales bacterium]
MALSPIGRITSKFYGSPWNQSRYSIVDLMSIIYMGGFIVFAIPASFLIHKTGITYSLRIASLLVIVGSLMKIIKVRSPSFLLVSQAIMSFSQAIILSMATVTVARWFPIRERGMAVGIVSACQYIALAFDMVFSPFLMSGGSFPRLIAIYSAISSGFAIIGALLIKENPPTPSSLIEPADESYLKASLTIGRINSLRGMITVFSVTWGVLMVMLVKIDFIAAELNLGSTAWFALALILSGAIGAFILPAISDAIKKRKVLFVGCLGLSLPGMLLLFFSKNRGMSYAGAVIFGFFAFSAIPIGLQYAAELGFPNPEEIVQSHMVFFSQGLGALILLLTMSGSIWEFRHLLSFFIALLLGCFIGSTFLDESKMIITEDERLDKEINREIVQNE